MQTNFPKNFLWGTATAAHQVEGNNTNSDFWVLERLPETLNVRGARKLLDTGI